MGEMGVTATTPLTPAPVATGQVHLAVLDGWRGVAVAAVVLFHADLLRGGWLGVDVFFVLSGFLITRLVAAEHDSTGRVSMSRFWARRARRLLPALVVFFAGVAVYATWYPDRASMATNLHIELAGAVGYVANWAQMAGTVGYWDSFTAESPLKHLWSLAIEEQFYVVFPVVMLGVLALGRTRPARVTVLLGAAATVSWIWGTRLLASGVDFERVYLGTDTRIGAILIGAAAGYASVRSPRRDMLTATARRAAPLAAFGVVIAMIGFDGARQWSPVSWMVLPLFEVGVCVLLLAAADPGVSRTATHGVLTSRPLVWLGMISYGLYLWHFPILLASERALRGSPRTVVVVVAICASLAAAEISSRVIENPLRQASLSPRRWMALGTVGAVVVVVSGVSLWHSGAPAREHIAVQATDGEVITRLRAADPASAPLRPTVKDLSLANPADVKMVDWVPSIATDDPMERAGLPVLPLPRPEGRNLRILLLGDSMATALAPGLERVAAMSSIDASSSGLVGCSVGGMNPADGFTGLGTPDQVRRCDEWRASWDELAQIAAPDVALVVRTSALRAGPATGGGLDHCSPEYEGWYRAELRAEAEALAPHVGVVAFTSPVYNRIFDIVDPGRDRSADCLADVTAQVAAEMDGVVYVPLGEWVCPTAGGCIIEDPDGIVLRPDGLHFQQDGADAAARWLLTALFG
jgi:peptidoglycan/LPS O-acetylase OafA/YrhL